MENKLKSEVKNELENHIIPFWSAMQDKVYGGFYGEMDFDLNVIKSADKGVILNSRILWFFSKTYEVLGDENLKVKAKHGYDFLINHCLDKENGGVYWLLDHKGNPKETIKHTYNQAFAIYALSAYYKISNDAKALELAMELFNLIEDKCRDENGYLECFSVKFEAIENDKLSENGVIAQRTMNTLLHVCEAYSGLFEVTKNQNVGKKLKEIINIFINKIYSEENMRQEVFFDLNYNSLIDLHSYGHDIESAWLIEWGCALLGDENLLKTIQDITSKMVKHVYEKAYNKNSLLNECENKIDDTTRVWWVQAEAIVGFVNEWMKYPNKEQYKTAAENIWDFTKNNIIDKRENGEWFWDIDEKFQPTSRKLIVEPWKCPYHNGRMCLEIMRRI